MNFREKTSVLSKIFDYIFYGVIGLLLFAVTLIFIAFIAEAILHPEVVKAREDKRLQQLAGLLTNDNCLDPVINKGFFDCPKNETSYTFKCTKNQTKLTGVLCESGASAYIRYDLNNFSK